MDKITFDTSAQAKWASDLGPADLAVAVKAEGFGDSLFDVAIKVPTYQQLQTAYQAEDRDSAFEAAFDDAFAFIALHATERDRGGYDKIFGFAQANGKEYPDEGWGAMLGNMDPPQMRTYIATIIRMGKTEAANTFPQPRNGCRTIRTMSNLAARLNSELIRPCR